MKDRPNEPDQQINLTIPVNKTNSQKVETKRIKQTNQRKRSLLKPLKFLTWKPYMTHFNVFNNSRKNLERDESATKSRKTGQIWQMHQETEERKFKEKFQK